jgi:sodium/proline symporter
MAISTPMLVTFLVYIFGMILIGFLAWRSTKNFDDYILGGRSLGPMVTALSAGASDMSGWLLMGLPGAIFISGISESWIAIGLTVGVDQLEAGGRPSARAYRGQQQCPDAAGLLHRTF